MILNFAILSISYFISDSETKNHIKVPNDEVKSHDFQYSNEGFYKITLNEKDTVNVQFFNRSLRLFFFIPDHQDFYIDDIIVDGKSVGTVEYRGLSIEGSDNATIKFASYKADQKIPAEFWLIRSSFCPNPSIYLYGNRKMEFGTSFGNKLCIFSPSFDSKNHEFTIRFGITKDFKKSISTLYTKVFDKPDETNNGTEVRTYTIDRSSFVQFQGDYSSIFSDSTSIFSTSKFFSKKNFKSDTGSFYYERITKLKKIEKTPCNVDFILRCKHNGCWSDYLPEFFWGCSDSKDLDKFMIVAIVLSVAVLLIIISWITVICVKKKKMKNESYLNSMLSDQNDNINKFQFGAYTK